MASLPPGTPLCPPEGRCPPPHQFCMTVMVSAGALMVAPLATEDRTPVLSGHPARHPPPPDLPWNPQSQTHAREDSFAPLFAPLALSRPPPAPPGARGPWRAWSGAVTSLHLPEPGTSVHFRRMASPWVHAHICGQGADSRLQPRCITLFCLLSCGQPTGVSACLLRPAPSAEHLDNDASLAIQT